MRITKEIINEYLCVDCKKLEYCKRQVNRDTGKNRDNDYIDAIKNSIKQSTRQANDLEISNWVPIRTNVGDASSPAGKKLQRAHDLFHQEEYEQANYLYHDLVESRNDYIEAWIGLAASYYFMDKYEEAYISASKIHTYVHGKMINRFVNSCLAKNSKMSEISIVNDKVKEFGRREIDSTYV